jgi:mannose-6-phosphate isomerase-like protein (cupin superfamily)
MKTDPGPFDIETTRLVLGPTGTATPKAVTPSFYEDLDREFDGFAGHVLVSRHAFDAAWPTWEMHPMGDEFVYLLDGEVDFVLWVDGRERIVRVDRPGCYVVVPRGTWHTARPRRPTVMLFVTPGEGTRNAEQPGGR